MKKVIIAMIVMALLIGWPGAGIWVAVFSNILGGGIAEEYLYPIYGGINSRRRRSLSTVEAEGEARRLQRSLLQLVTKTL